MAPTDNVHGSTPEPCARAPRLELPPPDQLSLAELVAIEHYLMERVHEVAQTINERIRRVAAETKLDHPALNSDTRQDLPPLTDGAE
jgi:hypothetical protein